MGPIEPRPPTVHDQFPAPPPGGWQTNDVIEVLRMRWHDVRRYRAAIAAEAYFLLTYVLNEHGPSMKDAAHALNVAEPVLTIFSKLATVPEDLVHGRKFERRKRAEPLMREDRQWLEVTGSMLLIRLAVEDPSGLRHLDLAELRHRGVSPSARNG